MTEQALVVAGHGSHRNPDSSSPVYSVVEAVRERGTFAEVRPAFWKEAPSIRNVLHTVDADGVIVVPLFVSEGYFVDRVLPREFALGEEDRADDDPPTVQYADPVGTHPAMTDVISARARRMLESAPDDPVVGDDTALAVVGHGTERNPNSADTVYDHVEALRERGTFAEVGALFMDEAPYVEDADEQFDADELAVVPLFAADGFHTRDEIPELLGLTDDPGTGDPVPAAVEGRRVWYASAVGTDPLAVDVVLERAEEAGANLDCPAGVEAPRPVREEAGAAFVSWVESASDAAESVRVWGELAVTPTEGGDYELRHRDDRDAPSADLDPLSLDDLRETVRYADDGRYRPFAGEESLPTGWVLSGLDEDGLLRAVSTVYPAGVEHWAAERSGDLETVSFRAVAERQTGIYDCVDDLSREEFARTVEACCGDCSKRREWAETDGEAAASLGPGAAADVDDGGIPCREPCSFLVAAAREFHRHESAPTDDADRTDESQTERPDADVPRGDLTDPANRYRVRYRRARGVTDRRPNDGRTNDDRANDRRVKL
ncbi:hypothetical protein BRC82_01120 [Halobacteriales archaeon QS_1_67_19]|nr:MAG: hypothetical protein BRC82_01120 [Halobacteriales archaeon QS_1_67_19]